MAGRGNKASRILKLQAEQANSNILLDIKPAEIYSSTDLYYNCRLAQQDEVGSGFGNLKAIFEDNRPAPIIEKPSQYRLSVIQFSITTDTLPLLYVEHPPQAGTNPTNTVYTFTLRSKNTGNLFTEVLQWEPEENLTQGIGDIDDPYWYVFNMISFVQLANNTLSTAMTALIADDPGHFTGVPAPFFQFNTASCTMTLYAPEEFEDSLATGGQIFCNEQSFVLFQGFPAYGDNSQDADHVWQYLIFRQPADTYVSVSGHNFVTMQQVPGSMSSWNPVKRIAFTTNIPVAPESATPQQSPSGQPIGSGITNQIILTDITPVVNRGDELASGSINYFPSGEFRFSDIVSDAPLSNLNFNVFWVDRYGGFHTFYLAHGGTSQAKILFRKKHF